MKSLITLTSSILRPWISSSFCNVEYGMVCGGRRDWEGEGVGEGVDTEKEVSKGN